MHQMVFLYYIQIKKVNSTSPPHSGIKSYTTGINSYKALLRIHFHCILFV